MKGTETIVLVEDDAELTRLIRKSLEREGFFVISHAQGTGAVEVVLQHNPDLVLLDVMLPGEDGLSICQRLKSRYCGPIMMLTARDTDLDEIIGLEIGADDYIRKPVSPRVLTARIRAMLRRRSEAPEPDAHKTLRLGELRIDPGSRNVSLEGSTIDLTTAEFDLLLYLAERVGQEVSRDELYQALKGIEYDGIDRSIDVRVSKVRLKLREASPHTNIIKTVHGRGYLLARSS